MDEFVSLISVDSIPILKRFTRVVIGLAVVVGFLVVFLSMYTAVLERTREIGILKALGASPGYIMTILLRETFLLAVVGRDRGNPDELRHAGHSARFRAHHAHADRARMVALGGVDCADGFNDRRDLSRASRQRGKTPSKRWPTTEDFMIEIRDLKKTYHVGEIDVHALRGVDLSLSAASLSRWWVPAAPANRRCFTFWAGSRRQLPAAIHIDGRDLLGMTEAERTNLRKTGVGFVFQKYNLLPTLTAADNIEIARDIAQRKGPLDPQFDEILGLLGLKGRLHHKPRALSGGEQQRVAIARAIVNHPAICCWPTNLPATWTRRIRKRCWGFCAI